MAAGRLLISGPLRSGTTLLARDVSARVLKLRSKPEITPLSDVVGLVSRWNNHYEETRYSAWIEPNDLSDKILALAMDQLMPVDEVLKWSVGKCPELVLYPKEVVGLLEGDTRLLLSVREPLDEMASVLEVWRKQDFGHSRRDYLNRVWQSYEGMRIILSETANTNKVKLVRYEEYVTNPERVLISIAEWLDVKTISSIMDLDPGVSQVDPYYTKLMSKLPTDERIGKFHDRLSEDDLHFLIHTFFGIRQFFGYAELEAIEERVKLGALEFV